jgi:hypothetical protein
VSDPDPVLSRTRLCAWIRDKAQARRSTGDHLAAMDPWGAEVETNRAIGRALTKLAIAIEHGEPDTWIPRQP